MMRVMNVFIADDDTDDLELFQEALNDICVTCNLTSSKDGLELLNKLAENTYRPELMFLDVNMPKMGGLECLEKIKSQQDFKDIPIIIFTTSTSATTVELAHTLGASMFVEKPSDYNDLKTMISKLIQIDWSHRAIPVPASNFIYKAS
jgi:CheY-like chemotaxis protein